MITIYSQLNPPIIKAVDVSVDTDTVQGIVTSLSMILNGMDDNNTKMQEMSYSGDAVVDLYPEVFGRPTRYELEYEHQAAASYAAAMQTTTDDPGDVQPTEPQSPSVEPEHEK